MVIAVTGSKGFIGSHLVKKLKDEGYTILEIDTQNGFNVTNKDHFKGIGKFDCIIHLAGKVSITESYNLAYEYLSHNYMGTLNVLELAKKYNAKFIFASSNIYGHPNYLPIDEGHPYQATNPYTQSKIMGEQLCQVYCTNFGLSCIALRQFNIYGPGMNTSSLIPTILSQVVSGSVKVRDVKPQRDYIFIDDVIEAYVKAIEYDCKGFEAFNIATGKSSSIKDIVKICENRYSKEIEIIDLSEPRKNEIFKIEANIDKAKFNLKWEPRITIEVGIRRLLDNHYNKDIPITSSKKIIQSEKTKNSYIPLSVPSFRGNEWNYVKECLDTEWVSSAGKFVDEFETKISEFTKSKYAVACVNGTAALHVSLLIAGVAPDDEVIVPAITFIAPVNAVHYCNAHPVFMDADKYYNIDANKTIDFILNETEVKTAVLNGNKSVFSFNKKTGRRITAIIPVHVFGNAVWLDDLYKICNDRNIKIIEDATESLGTRYSQGKFKGKHTGTIGELGCISFNGNKIITTGGGGMILTDNKELAVKAKYLTTQAKDDDERFIHNSIGYNYRLTNLLAGLGLAQLEQMQDYLRIKKENYFFYKEEIGNIIGLHLAEVPEYANNNYWMYALQIDQDKYLRDKDELMAFLSKNNIQSRPVWYLNHLQKAYRKYQAYKIEYAEELLKKTLNIPCSVNLSKSDLERVIENLNAK
ncbi:MAG TPA: LegC family aminotransferase [Ignavibacteriales bacterium]|nr:LegC family aminotransferase [Ignavibacteriales bacterium]